MTILHRTFLIFFVAFNGFWKYQSFYLTFK